MGPLKNTKHEAFVQAVFAGKKHSAAYIENVSAACTPAAAASSASDLLITPKVAERLDELKNTTVTGVVLTKEWLVSQMIDTAAQAAADRAHAPRTRALELLGREKSAFMEPRGAIILSFDQMTTQQIEDFLAAERARKATAGDDKPSGEGTRKAKAGDPKPRRAGKRPR